MLYFKSKRAQGVFGMPFSVIFSIFLIAIFLVVAIFAIKYFLGWNEDIKTGAFLNDFQKEIDSAWNSQTSTKTFKGDLSSKVEYVCFANLSATATANVKDKEGKDILSELKKNAIYSNNFFFYPRRYATPSSMSINHVSFANATNPYCIPVENGKVEVKIEKGFSDALVSIR